MKKLYLILLAMMLIFAGNVWADKMLPLTDTSFEGPDLSAWVVETGDTGVVNVAQEGGVVNDTPYGSQWLYMSADQDEMVAVGQPIGSPASLLNKTVDISFIMSSPTSTNDPSVHVKVSIIAGTASGYTNGDVLGTVRYDKALISVTDIDKVEFLIPVKGTVSSGNNTLWLVIENPYPLDHVVVYYDNIRASIFQTGRAENVYPADGAEDIPVSPTLQWGPGDDPNGLIQGYLVYVGKDSMGDVVNGALVTSGTSYTVTGLDTDSTYQWRIDTWLGGSTTDPNNYVTGDVWTFDTVKTIPVINSQPQDKLLANPGFDATFTIDATNPLGGELSYQWYFDPNTLLAGDEVALNNGDRGGRISGADSATLTIGAVETADEGSYYCTVTNTTGTVTSDLAALTVGRMIAHYPFDDNANDTSGYGNNGTWFGNESYENGMIGKAATFDGSSYVSLGTTGAPNSDLGGMAKGSVSFWYKSSNTTETAIAGSFNSTGSNGFQILLNRGGNTRRLSVYVRDTNGRNHNIYIQLPVGQSVADGKWHHVAITWGSPWRAFFDGVSYTVYGSTGGPWNFVPWEYSMDIGARQNRATVDKYMTGAIDDYRLYNYILNGQEIAKLYTDVRGGSVCVEHPQYDFNGDCVVDVNDLAAMAAEWLQCGLFPSSACN